MIIELHCYYDYVLHVVLFRSWLVLPWKPPVNHQEAIHTHTQTCRHSLPCLINPSHSARSRSNTASTNNRDDWRICGWHRTTTSPKIPGWEEEDLKRGYLLLLLSFTKYTQSLCSRRTHKAGRRRTKKMRATSLLSRGKLRTHFPPVPIYSWSTERTQATRRRPTKGQSAAVPGNFNFPLFVCLPLLFVL